MRSAITSFVLGVVILQQQAYLLELQVLVVSLILLLSALLIALRLQRRGYPTSANAYRYLYRSCILILSAMLGFVWASLFATYYLSVQLPKEWEGRDITVIGVVSSLPHHFQQGLRFNFKIEQTLEDRTLAATLPKNIALAWYFPPNSALSASEIGAPNAGERWQLTLRLKRPYGNANPLSSFDYEVWLLEQQLRATGYVRPDGAYKNQRIDAFVWSPNNLIQRSRSYLRDRIQTALVGAPYAGVIVALVIGDQRGVAQSDWKIFNRTGISHLVSISGLHITMQAGLFGALMHYLWRHSFFTNAQLPLYLPAQKVAALTGMAVALLYVALAGFGVPAQRTLYMLSVVAAAMWSGRLTSVSHTLCLALLVVVLLDPWAVLWPGFWLSFVAVAILIFGANAQSRSSPQNDRLGKIWGVMRQASRTQYVVTMGLLPLTMLLFGQVSLISPLANALAIPLISLVVTPLSLLGSVLPAPFSNWLLQFAHFWVQTLVRILELLSQYDFAVWRAPIPPFILFAIAMLGTLWLLAPRGWPLPWLGLFCYFPLFINSEEPQKKGEMRVTAFDVGQGMALLVETAQHRLLYDTGPYYSPESDGGSRVLLPYFNARGISHLDTLVVSHNDNDHSGGALSLLAGMQVDLLSSSLKLDSAIVSAAARHSRCAAGQAWDWDGVHFEMLQPTSASYDSDKWKPNARSCTLKISTPTLSLLLPGDIEAIQEDEMLNSIAPKLLSTVLLAPHHGSGTSSTPAFLRAVQPQVAIFQVGYRNRYHHPKPEVFDRYAEFGVNRLRTDESGAITLQFGTTLLISEFRTEHARYWYRR
ncbi:DNA internalization-related competence protein ComEC/Rec2 [Undibacterium parvum]|uniref:DNA internalization-related competence protein ComEC/Rec2 n=1 Tax=Undibacterium parvum TaxID=401471 RepID=A0A3S9HPG2_9BURK|nr:DNA internalization-related competence protein ComEC/Rec2 [Undibacterium parvum]